MTLGWQPEAHKPETFVLEGEDFDLGQGSDRPLDDWSESAAMLFAPGCETQAVVLLASFAAPLMALWPGDGGGVVVSAHGAVRSGRSTAVAAAASVWGAPDATRIRGPRVTDFERLRSLPMISEAMAQRDPAVVAHALQIFTAAESDWASVLISVGALPLRYSSAVFPGIELEISVPRALVKPKNADRIAERLLGCRGHAGRRYIDYLQEPKARLLAKSQMGAQVAALREEVGENEDLLLTMRAIAACHVAGTMACGLGLLDYHTDRITGWLVEKLLLGNGAE